MEKHGNLFNSTIELQRQKLVQKLIKNSRAGKSPLGDLGAKID